MELCGLYTAHKTDVNADNAAYPIHSHSSHEILIVCSGVCGIIIGDTEYEISENDAALIFPDNLHSLVIKKAPVEYLAAQFIERADSDTDLTGILSRLSDKCKNKSGTLFKINKKVYPTVVSCMRRICDERSAVDIDIYFSYIKSILCELYISASEKNGVPSERTRKKSGGSELLNAIIDYIGENLSMINDLSFVEKTFHYSNSHVNRLFRKTLGVSVWQYITIKRLDLAHNLITQGQSAKSAAVSCGFSDYSVFYKSYVKHFGKSPSSLKSEVSKNTSNC